MHARPLELRRHTSRARPLPPMTRLEKPAMHSTPQPWFQTAIAMGLRSLLPMGLDGQPATDLLPPLILTWTADLWAQRRWDQQQHSERIANAFAELRRTSERWPGMFHFNGAWARASAQPAAPDEPKPQIEWHKHRPQNRSAVARAHAKFNAARLSLPCPKWAEADDDVSEEQIAAVLGELKARRAA